MEFQEFITKNIGKRVDFDGKFGAQCMDLYRFYVRDVWGLPQTPGVQGAFQVFNSLPGTFDKFPNMPQGIPLPGDVITWNEGIGKDGHIGIVVTTDVNKFSAFQQNAPKSDVNGIKGSPCNIGTYSYKNVIGWFRPKGQLTPMPMPKIHNFLGLLSGLDSGNNNAARTALQLAQTWFQDIFGSDLIYQTLVAEKSGLTLKSIHVSAVYGPDYTSADTVIIDPTQIIQLGHEQELALGKEFQTVGFIYDQIEIVGDKTTNDVHDPLYDQGFTTFQIIRTRDLHPESIDWNQAIQSIFGQIIHEQLHTLTGLIGDNGGPQLTDEVHLYSLNNTDPSKTYKALLLKYKPYWQYLGIVQAPVTQGDKMTYKRVKVNGANAVLIDGPDFTVIAKANTPPELIALGKVYPVVTQKPDGSADFTTDIPDINFPT